MGGHSTLDVIESMGLRVCYQPLLESKRWRPPVLAHIRRFAAFPFFLIGWIFLPPGTSQAQQAGSGQPQIEVLARPSPDSIVLRWAPVNAETWIAANKYGYHIERFTIVREGAVVNPPVREKLTETPLTPWPEALWERLVAQNKYAAIAAQALLGGSFEMNMEGADVLQIVNKVKENEMRFSFALYSADLSAPVSVALGLRLTDKEVKEGEKYLYRIYSIAGTDTLKGSIYTWPQAYQLPQPMDFSLEVDGQVVSMKWDQSLHKGVYTTYRVERSADGQVFAPLSEDGLVTLSSEDKPESRYQYATDSLPDDGKAYLYRVRGLTPFGEWGPPTQELSALGTMPITEVPYIRANESTDNLSIAVYWDFPLQMEKGLKGFELRRAANSKDKPVAIHQEIILPSLRSFRDMAPFKNNYYQVVALSLKGEEFKSPLHLAQLVDSIPPVPPIGLQGKVDGQGKVSFSWTPNSEKDIYGYRIYRGNNIKEEFSQITVEPIKQVVFSDSVDLHTLNRHIYYQVMALDNSQNHSGLSEILTLDIPDKIPPVPPVFLPFTSTKEGVGLFWTPSSSDDVQRYDVYARLPAENQWKRVATADHVADSAMGVFVRGLEEGVRMHFTVLAVDQAGLESSPAEAVTAARLLDAVKPPVIMAPPEVDRDQKRVRFTWTYDQPGVNHYQVYRAREGMTATLYKTLPASAGGFEDGELLINTVYTYQVVALFSTGARSEFSEGVVVEY